MPRPYPDESFDEAVDRQHDEYVQGLVDAFAEGQQAGRQGLAAGLCPQDLTAEEQAEWHRGRTYAIGMAHSTRRAA
jgi:hypothetical protein